ncbi:hypothetical protein HQ535_12730 [bacterium]|nr:hypothetical protein [bacterium]
MAFRADALREIGMFDPALGAGSRAFGGDDLAAFLAVVSAGHRLVYEPAAIVHHEHRRDEDTLARQVFGYGAGLTAYLTGALIARPSRMFDLIKRMPGGIRYAVSSSSEKNIRQDADFPSRLRRRELLGMLAGPWAYLRSMAEVRRSGTTSPDGEAI